AIMHHRGTFAAPAGNITRASVWIEQEIAIAAFMGQILNRRLWTVSYYQEGIQLEGVRQFILLNPKKFRTSEDVLVALETVLATWTGPLNERLTNQQREAIRRKLAVARIHAEHPRLTIWVTNHADSPISVKSISLWHDQKRLCRGTPSDSRRAVEVRPHTQNTGIAFTMDDDPVLQLQSLGAVDRHLPTYEFRDDVDIEVRIEYETFGTEDEYRETVRPTVQGNKQIISRPI